MTTTLRVTYSNPENAALALQRFSDARSMYVGDVRAKGDSLEIDLNYPVLGKAVRAPLRRIHRSFSRLSAMLVAFL